MTTTANPKNPLAEQKPVEYKSVSIPLAEFGKSLADAGLDDWFEAFAERNSYEGQTYEISGTGYLLIMPPTGSPGDIHELNLAAFLWNWARIYGGIVRGPTTRFHLPDGSRPGPRRIVGWRGQEERTNAGRKPAFHHFRTGFRSRG